MKLKDIIKIVDSQTKIDIYSLNRCIKYNTCFEIEKCYAELLNCKVNELWAEHNTICVNIIESK